MTATATPVPARPIEEQGSVAGSGEVEIAAPPEVVWEVLTAFTAWPQWNPDVKWVEIDDEIEPGTVFRWKAGPSKITSTIESVEAFSSIAWTGKTLGLQASHAWWLERSEAGTVVRSQESFEGFAARLFRGSMQKTLDSALATALNSLKTEAERR